MDVLVLVAVCYLCFLLPFVSGPCCCLLYDSFLFVLCVGETPSVVVNVITTTNKQDIDVSTVFNFGTT